MLQELLENIGHIKMEKTEIISEIANARDCIFNVTKKEIYDMLDEIIINIVTKYDN